MTQRLGMKARLRDFVTQRLDLNTETGQLLLCNSASALGKPPSRMFHGKVPNETAEERVEYERSDRQFSRFRFKV